MSLHPTKTRLALLQAVADGAVAEHYPLLPGLPYSLWNQGNAVYRKVTATVAEQRRAGWIRLGERDDGSHYKSPRLWRITNEGQHVLTAAGAAS